MLPQPFADDGFRLTAGIAGCPGGIDIGGIDCVQTRIDKGVEEGEAGLLVNRPAKHVAAKDEGGDIQSGRAKGAELHGAIPLSLSKA